jgi:cell wall-associated NlpC family hydrolase
VASGYAVPHASADQVGDLRAQAQALAAKITLLGRQEDALGQQYDEATIQLASAQQNVATAAAAVAKADATTSKARNALKQEAINDYIEGGSNNLADVTTVNNANESLLAAEYADSLASNATDAVDQYHLASLQDQAAKQTYQTQQAALESQVAQLAQDKQAALNAQDALQATLNQDTGQIRALVAQQQAAEKAAQQRAANARLAAERLTLAYTGPNNAAPPPGHGAAGAVAAALTRVGDPYVWGAAGPTTFDCSGLVMWAYDQVGVSLPHFSGAQYADGVHISMSQLEPGDLVFPSDPSQHVAIYIGNGDIVQAPYTGADVQVVPLSSFFVLAVRIA